MPELSRVTFNLYRYPLARPLVTVFGRIEARPALVLTLEDNEGAVGFGEIWCNFPAPGAEYRNRLAADIARGALTGLDPLAPQKAFATIRSRINRLALQAGESGPADQIAAGLDIAMHDLAARRQNLSLAALLGGAPRSLVPYASGIGPPDAEDRLGDALAAGYRAFKLRIGFGPAQDLRAIAQARELAGAASPLMLDANQNWSIEEAIETAEKLAGHDIAWLEEPIAADRPATEWSRIAAATAIPIAAGENMAGRADYDAAIKAGFLSVIQPDVCKWGGLSGCIDVARAIRAAGRRYCPHYLGGGVGLAASAHLLAAAGGDGLLEVDVNDNLLRELLAGPLFPLSNGAVQVPDGPGLGYVPDLQAVRQYRVDHQEVVL